MASLERTLRLRVEVDEDKLKALEAAEDRFRAASKELQDATDAVRTAMRDMQDALNVQRVVEE